MPARIAKRPKPGPQWPGFFVCAFVLSAAVSGDAAAQVQATGDYLARMDADGDGRVALVEYQDWMSYAFDGMDRDRDGVLSASELPGGKGGPISRNEHRARLAARFNKQDANRDGFLDAKELAAPPR
jgi:hypothetical protein